MERDQLSDFGNDEWDNTSASEQDEDTESTAEYNDGQDQRHGEMANDPEHNYYDETDEIEHWAPYGYEHEQSQRRPWVPRVPPPRVEVPQRRGNSTPMLVETSSISIVTTANITEVLEVIRGLGLFRNVQHVLTDSGSDPNKGGQIMFRQCAAGRVAAHYVFDSLRHVDLSQGNQTSLYRVSLMEGWEVVSFRTFN